MIASQKIGKSFMGAFNYNYKKLHHPDLNQRAELLDLNFTVLDPKQVKQEVDLLRSLHPNLNRYVYHTSLNFSVEEADQLDNEKLLSIAHDYLKGMGFTGNQFLIFRHYDAEHPHLHVLANRISFDGSVVSDSNNYKRSEALVKKLEKKYNLRSVEQATSLSPDRASSKSLDQAISGSADQKNGLSLDHASSKSLDHASIGSADQKSSIAPDQGNNLSPEQEISRSADQAIRLSQRAPTRPELAMIERTGKASDKMILQELLGALLRQRCRDLNEFISKGEKVGISFLFNDSATTGRVSGITYFYKDFKATGKGLGNSFKWGEISKNTGYEQSRDSAAVSEANSRTKAKYGELGAAKPPEGISADRQSAKRGRQRSTGLSANPASHSRNHHQQPESVFGVETNSGAGFTANKPGRESPLETNQDAALDNYPSFDHLYDRSDLATGIEISDDIDDEAILGRNRHRKKQARTNRR